MRSSVVDSRRSSEVRGSRPEPTFHSQNPNVYPKYATSKVPTRPRGHQQVLEPQEGWLALLLLAVAVYCVVGAIVTAAWVDHSSVLLWSPLAGMLAGFVVAKTPRLPQALLHLAACLMGHWLSIWLTSIVAFHVDWLLLLGSLRSIIFGGGISQAIIPNSDMIFFFYLAFLCFFLGYFGCWLVYRAHLPWLVALVYCSIMLVNLNSFTRQDLSYLVIILLGSLILLIARVQLTNQVLQWRREGLHTDRAWLRSMNWRCMQITSVLTLLALLLTVALPIQSQPASGQALWNNLDTAWNNIVSGHVNWKDLNSLTRSYQAPANFFGDQLTISGSVHLPMGEVLSYVSSGGPHYLEGFTYNLFDGHTWTSSVTTNASDIQSYGAKVPLKLDVLRNDYMQITTTVTIAQPPEGVKHYLFGPAQPSSFGVPTYVYGDGTSAAWAQQSQLVRGEKYQVTSMVPPSDAQTLSNVPLPNANLDYWNADANTATLFASYRQVPHDLSPTILATTKQWTQGATDTYSALKMLEAHLSDQNMFTYSVENAPIPNTVDVVDWLLQTRRGYCTYYASAMAVMARQLGIPTRVVNGFSYGHYDAQRKAWIAQGDDAHSWVQAYFPNWGWISFDPTPGFAPVTTTQPQSTPTPISTPPPTKPKTKATPPVKVTPPAKNQKPPMTPDPKVPASTSSALISQDALMWFSLLVLLCSLLFFIGALATRWWRNLYANSTMVSGLFWRLCQVASWAGFSPRTSQTPYEYSSMLIRHFPQSGRSLWHLTELFVRDRWGDPRHVPHEHDEIDAQQHWLHLRKSLMQLMLKRVKR